MPPERHRPSTHAVSISTFLQHPHFQVPSHANLFVETLFRYQAQMKFLLHGFAIMPNHVHLLLTPAGEIAKAIQLVKGGYSFAARQLTPKEIWHSGYHEHRVRDLDDLHNQLKYIANNPPSARMPPDYLHVHTHPTHAARLDPPPEHIFL